MNCQNVIVVIAPTLEVWGNFKKLCEAKGFDILPYHSLKSKPFPIIHNDWIITQCTVSLNGTLCNDSGRATSVAKSENQLSKAYLIK